MRKRMIDPEIWDSAMAKDWSATDFVVMVAAISAADDEGRGRLSMVYRNISFMISEKNFKKSLSNLSDSISIYEKIYYFLPKFKLYQWISKPKPSKYPEPKLLGNSDLTVKHSKTIPIEFREDSELVESNRIELNSNSKQTETEQLTPYPDFNLPLLTNYEEYEPKNFTDDSHVRNRVENLLKSFTGLIPDRATVTRFFNIVTKTNKVKRETAFRFCYENCMEFPGFTQDKKNFAYLSKRITGKINDALTEALEKRSQEEKSNELTEVENMNDKDTLSLITVLQNKFSVK